MKPMLMFGAVMSITQAFGVCDVTMALCGYPSTDYAARTWLHTCLTMVIQGLKWDMHQRLLQYYS